MAVLTWELYGEFKLNQNINTNLVDLATDALKVMLVTSAYSPNVGSDEYASTPQADEVPAGTAYSAGGVAVTGQTCTQASGTVTFSMNNVVIAQDASTGFTTARYAILYKSTGTMSTSPLIAYLDLGADYGNTGGSLTIQIDASGVFTEA